MDRLLLFLVFSYYGVAVCVALLSLLDRATVCIYVCSSCLRIPLERRKGNAVGYDKIFICSLSLLCFSYDHLSWYSEREREHYYIKGVVVVRSVRYGL